MDLFSIDIKGWGFSLPQRWWFRSEWDTRGKKASSKGLFLEVLLSSIQLYHCARSLSLPHWNIHGVTQGGSKLSSGQSPLTSIAAVLPDSESNRKHHLTWQQRAQRYPRTPRAISDSKHFPSWNPRPSGRLHTPPALSGASEGDNHDAEAASRCAQPGSKEQRGFHGHANLVLQATFPAIEATRPRAPSPRDRQKRCGAAPGWHPPNSRLRNYQTVGFSLPSDCSDFSCYQIVWRKWVYEKDLGGRPSSEKFPLVPLGG